MVLLWLGLGALVGTLSAPPDGGMISLVSGAMAGMIVLPGFGAMFGLLGARWWEPLLGAACGLVTSFTFGFLNGSTRLGPNIGLYLLFGAFAGSTLPQAYRLNIWLARQAISRFRSFRTDEVGASSGSAAPGEGVINP